MGDQSSGQVRLNLMDTFGRSGQIRSQRWCPRKQFVTTVTLLEPHRRSVQIVGVSALDLDCGDLADPQRPAA